MIRIAMLSYWHVHAKGYAREASESGLARIAAVWDELPERGREEAAAWGVPFYARLEDALADVDAVVVNAPTGMHEEVITAAARAGKHIFTEKVLTPDAASARRVADAVARAGIRFCISLPQRGIPRNLMIKRVVDSGALGGVYLVRMRNAHSGSSDGWLPPHFYDPAACGGGAMIDLGAHPMYLIGWLLGEPVKISSMFTHVTGRAVEDNAVCAIAFPGGAIGVSETGFVSKASPASLEVYGDQGTAMVCGPEEALWIREAGAGAFRRVAEEEMPPAAPRPMAQFLSAIAGEGAILYGMDDAVALTRLMEGAYRAFREERTVYFSEIG